MRHPAIVLGVLLLAAGVLHAGIGDVKYVPCEPRKALVSRPLYAQERQFTAPSEGAGTVHPRATVAKIRQPGVAIAVAVDAGKADAKIPDLVRIDLTGEGKFQDAHTVALKLKSGRGTSQTFHFGPATIDLKRGGKTIPLTVEGAYYKSGSSRYLSLALGMAGQATCTFGEKTYPVRIIDGNGNLRLGDRGQRQKYRTRVVGISGADTVVVDTGDGTFETSGQKSFYGEPVLLDGRYYSIKLSADGSKIAAAPLKLAIGRLRIDQDEYTATLFSDKHVLRLRGGRKPIPVPAGTYTLMSYELVARKESGAKPWRMQCGRQALYTGKPMKVEVKADEAAELTIGAPLKGSLDVSKSGRSIRFSMKLVDASGTQVDSVRTSKDGRPPAPKIKILGADGKEVASILMKYG